MNDRLTLNLGVRYDLLWNMFQNQEEFLPFMESGRPQNDQHSAAAQVHVSVGHADGRARRHRQVLARWCRRRIPSEAKTVAVVEVLNDGRPDFAANPFNGPAPTYEQALQRYCAAPEQAANFAAWKRVGSRATRLVCCAATVS